MNMHWRAWYDDGALYNSANHAWNDLPAEGIQVAIQYNADGTRVIFDGGDWYWLVEPTGPLRYIPSGDWGTWQPRPPVSCQSCIKQGTRVADSDFAAIHQLALASRWP